MELRGKRVLVTGGAGFIGSHLVDALGASEVRVLDDLSTGRPENLEPLRDRPTVHFIQGSILDHRALANVLQGIDVVFHLACRGVRHSISQPLENHEVNATGTLRVLEEARRASVQRFVHVSSSEVYGTARYVPMDENHPCFPETVYGAAKLAGEAYARAAYSTHQFPTIVVRPFNNFGPRSHHEGDAGEVIPRFAAWALNGRPPLIFGDGRQTRDFVYVGDTAYWLCRIAETDDLIGKTLNLGSGKETSVREIARIVYEEAGQPAIAPQYRPARPGDVRRHCAGITLAEQSIGFRVRTTLPDGIRQLLEYFRTRREGVEALLGQMQELNWTPSP